MEWRDWHKQYEISLVLLARLRIVREQIQAALEECAAGPVRLASLCAGDGRDVIEALSGHARLEDITAWLLDTDAPSLDRGRSMATAAGVAARLQFIRADATLAQSYDGIAPADLVIVSGVMGHLSHDGIRVFLENLPMLCKSGGSVVWNRHLIANEGAKDVVEIRNHLQRLDFEEAHFSVTSRNGFAVGRSRFRGTVMPFDATRRIFEFIGLDQLLEAARTVAAPSEAQAVQDHTPRMPAVPLPPGVMSRAEVEQSLPSCFERQAALHPHRKALGSGSWQPDYTSLNQAANRLAHALLSRGVTPGARCALLLEHDSPLIAAMLAALKAGGVVVVLNASDPPSRLGKVLRDAEPAAILSDATHRELARQIAEGACDVLCVEDHLEGPASPNPAIPISPEDTAFLVYTSGSTGPPKGVMQSHRSILHKVFRVAGGIGLRTEDRMLLLASLSGGQGVNTTWCALSSGATLCPFPIMTRGVTGLADWMSAHAISVYVSAASVFRHFTRTLEDTARLDHTRLVWLASEPAMAEDLASFRTHFNEDCVLFHTLASSETGVITQLRLTAADIDALSGDRLPVGQAVTDMELILLDENALEVPRGETGEISVKSSYLFTGYWKDAALTERRLSDGGDGTKIFRTGDRARLGADGRLWFMGRQDTRVNVHGYRVELSEIEHALSLDPSVDRAAVSVCERASGDVQLVAYVVRRSGHAGTPEILRQGLRGFLPGHMIPSAFVFLDRLPLTPHGKVDREALRHMAPAAPVDNSGNEPFTETEKRIAKAWAEVFERNTVSREDDFFDLGGDSLTAAVIAAKLHHELGVQLDLRAFADHPVLTDLARAVDALRAAPPSGSSLSLEPVPRDQPLPLSFVEERTWQFSQTPSVSISYNVAAAYHLRGPLNVAVLEECLDFLVRRHELLRTSYPVVDGKVTRRIHPPSPAPLTVIDLSATADPEEESLRLMREESLIPVDLASAPFHRFRLARLRQDEHRLFSFGHHIAWDALALDIFVHELSAVYEARLGGGGFPLPESGMLQYADYAAWQRRAISPGTRAFQDNVTWWQQQLLEAPPPLELPFLRPEPKQDVPPHHGVIWFNIPSEVRDRIDRIQATYFVVRLAGFAALLAAETGQPDVVLGAYATNRNNVATQKMLGDFSNLIALRLLFDGRRTFREWVSLVGAQVSGAYAHAEVPHELLCEELRQRGAVAPEIRVIFGSLEQLGRMPSGGIDFARLRVRWGNMMPWGFSMSFGTGDAGDRCVARFDAGVYDPAGVQRFIDQLCRLLDDASREPDRPFADLLAGYALPSGATLRRVDARSQAWGSVDQSLPAAFEARFAAHRTRMAIGLGKWRPSYQDVHDVAIRLANMILERGGSTGDRVALFMRQEAPLVVAMLGVLQAGCIVVTLNPADSPARLRAMLADAEPSLLLTDEAHLARARDIAGAALEVVSLGQIMAVASSPVVGANLPIAPDAPAFLFYFASLADKPKAVIQNHRNLLHAVRNYSVNFNLTTADRIVLLGDLSSAQGVVTALCALLNGATLLTYSLRRQGIAVLPDWLRRRRISVFIADTTVFRQLAALMPAGLQLPFMRHVCLEAEPALRSDWDSCWRHFSPECRFSQVLSAKETCHTSIFTAGRSYIPDHDLLPVGFALPGRRVMLLREDSTEAATGEMGEIAVRSAYLSPGYWRDEAATARAFQSVPASHERIYRSGDLGRWRSDGQLEHLGRKDAQSRISDHQHPAERRVFAPLIPLPSRTAFETRVTRAWTAALGGTPESVYESFSRTSGGAFQAVDLMRALAKEFGQKLPRSLLVAHPTIAQFAEALESGTVPGISRPWCQLPSARLLPLREEGSSRPILFIPGGCATEHELLAFASLTAHLDGDHPVSGVRLNLRSRRVLPPLSLHRLTRSIGKAWIQRHGSQPAMIVGERHSCALACDLSRWLARRISQPPLLVLLHPSQPRPAPPAPMPSSPAARRYHDLLRGHRPTPYSGEVHLLFATESGGIAAGLAWWRDHLGAHCAAGEVPGNHETNLARWLDGILRAHAHTP